jgi:hypothetical protein
VDAVSITMAKFSKWLGAISILIQIVPPGTYLHN